MDKASSQFFVVAMLLAGLAFGASFRYKAVESSSNAPPEHVLHASAKHHAVPVNRWLDDPLVPPLTLPVDIDSDPVAHFHPHGSQTCASGCALSNHPTANLTATRFQKLLTLLFAGEEDESNAALDSLVYFGPQTERLLQSSTMTTQNKTAAKRLTALRTELRRNHVRVSVRLVDDAGEVRALLTETRVPLDRRHVFEMETKNLQPMVVSGTVKRVGVDRLWTRL